MSWWPAFLHSLSTFLGAQLKSNGDSPSPCWTPVSVWNSLPDSPINFTFDFLSVSVPLIMLFFVQVQIQPGLISMYYYKVHHYLYKLCIIVFTIMWKWYDWQKKDVLAFNRCGAIERCWKYLVWIKSQIKRNVEKKLIQVMAMKCADWK